LLGTTRDFLDYFGLKKLDQLPPLAELKSLEQLDPQMLLPEPIGVVVDGGDGTEPQAEAATPTLEAAANDDSAASANPTLN
jgi:segregation and condensation protein B